MSYRFENGSHEKEVLSQDHQLVEAMGTPGENQMWAEPPLFHFQPDEPTVDEGFCIYGRWAPTNEGIAVLEIGLGPSCYVTEGDGLRRRRPDETPQRAGVVGVNSDAIRLIRLIDIREGLHRAFINLQQDVDEVPEVAFRYLRELIDRSSVTGAVPRPRRRGRPTDASRKRQRAEDVIQVFSESPRGARQELVDRWNEVTSTDSVGSEIKRLIAGRWLERNPSDEGPRYVAGPALIAAQEGESNG